MPKDPPTIVNGIVELRRKRQQELKSFFTRPVLLVLSVVGLAALALVAAYFSRLPH